MRFITEISVYKVIDMNKSIKNKEFEGVNKKIPKGKELLTRNLNIFILFKILRASSLASK